MLIKEKVGWVVWGSWPIEARHAIEMLEREQQSICDVCEALQDSPISLLKTMTSWSKRVRGE